MTDELKTLSPTPRKTDDGLLMFKFSGIIELLLEGAKIHKLDWEDKEYYAIIDKKDGVLKLHKTDGKLYQWILSQSDMEGTDYTVL